MLALPSFENLISLCAPRASVGFAALAAARRRDLEEVVDRRCIFWEEVKRSGSERRWEREVVFGAQIFEGMENSRRHVTFPTASLRPWAAIRIPRTYKPCHYPTTSSLWYYSLLSWKEQVLVVWLIRIRYIINCDNVVKIAKKETTHLHNWISKHYLHEIDPMSHKIYCCGRGSS